MQYQGGKERIAQRLADVMLEHRADETTYLEPFMGGCSVLARMAPHFSQVSAGDSLPELVAMWSAASAGWAPPEVVSRETYAALKAANDPSDPMTGFAAFGLSFGGKRWGGYASNRRGDDFAGAARRGVIAKAARLTQVRFACAGYEAWAPGEGSLVYADPPYAGTTGYAGTDPWHADKFWATMSSWSRSGARVFVSEYEAPPGWVSVWSRSKRMTLEKGDNLRVATEHLFMAA